MAKSIEQKAVESLASGLSDYRFRLHEFSRLMSEENPFVHREFFKLIVAYLNYLAVFDKYGWYPNGTQNESSAAAEVVETLNKYIS